MNLRKSFNINEIVEQIKAVFFRIVMIPFEMFLKLPTWVRVTVLVFLMLLTLIIAVLVYKNRDEMYRVFH